MLEKFEKPGRLSDFAIDVDPCPLGLKVYCRSLSLPLSLSLCVPGIKFYLLFLQQKFQDNVKNKGQIWATGRFGLFSSDLRSFGRVFLSQASALRELEEAKSYVARRLR